MIYSLPYIHKLLFMFLALSSRRPAVLLLVNSVAITCTGRSCEHWSQDLKTDDICDPVRPALTFTLSDPITPGMRMHPGCLSSYHIRLDLASLASYSNVDWRHVCSAEQKLCFQPWSDWRNVSAVNGFVCWCLSTCVEGRVGENTVLLHSTTLCCSHLKEGLIYEKRRWALLECRRSEGVSWEGCSLVSLSLNDG